MLALVDLLQQTAVQCADGTKASKHVHGTAHSMRTPTAATPACFTLCNTTPRNTAPACRRCLPRHAGPLSEAGSRAAAVPNPCHKEVRVMGGGGRRPRT